MTARRRVAGRLHRLAVAVGAGVLALTLVVAPEVGAASVARARPATLPIPRCQTPGLVVWLDTNGNGAAGSSYYNLQFTNLSGSSCSLVGFPGVSAVGLPGAQIGLSAGRSAPGAGTTVRLAPGATSTSVLQLTDAGNFPSSTCHEVRAAGLRVYPPGATASKVVPYPFEACASHSATFLHVRPVEKGVGA